MSDARPVPPPTATSAPFWDATRERRLTMQRCGSCTRLVWFPRPLCPHCGGEDLAWEDLSGEGVVYAVTIHHRAAHPALAERTPYAVVLVDLAEGARIMSNVFGAVPAVGDTVTIDWEPLEDGRQLPVFTSA